MKRMPILIMAALASGPLAALAQPPSVQPPSAQSPAAQSSPISFVEPSDGATVRSPFVVRLDEPERAVRLSMPPDLAPLALSRQQLGKLGAQPAPVTARSAVPAAQMAGVLDELEGRQHTGLDLTGDGDGGTDRLGRRHGNPSRAGYHRDRTSPSPRDAPVPKQDRT